MVYTYYKLYSNIKAELKKYGISNPEFEAKLIVCHAAGKSPAELIRDYSIYTTQSIINMAYSYCEERAKDKPLAYILGRWEFCGLDLMINEKVLIPRDDTMLLAESAVEEVENCNHKARVLDLCTGSGCVGLAIAKLSTNCKSILLGDLSKEALSIAKINMQLNKPKCLSAAISVDVLKEPDISLGKFDIIVSNPPYIPTDEILTLDTSVKDFEPHMALDGGKDGLIFYRSLAVNWKKALTENGKMLVEIGCEQEESVKAIYEENGFINVRCLRDLQNHPRVIIAENSN